MAKRTMRCTLKEEIVKSAVKGTGKPVADDVIPVWDLENNGWRSFKHDSVISVEMI